MFLAKIQINQYSPLCLCSLNEEALASLLSIELPRQRLNRQNQQADPIFAEWALLCSSSIHDCVQNISETRRFCIVCSFLPCHNLPLGLAIISIKLLESNTSKSTAISLQQVCFILSIICLSPSALFIIVTKVRGRGRASWNRHNTLWTHDNSFFFLIWCLQLLKIISPDFEPKLPFSHQNPREAPIYNRDSKRQAESCYGWKKKKWKIQGPQQN